MPPANEKLTENFLLRELIYGNMGTKKTLWACKAAEDGYNIILADGDQGYHIINQIAPEFRNRIHVIECGDGLNSPDFARFITYLCKGNPFVWSEKYKSTIGIQSSCKLDSSHYFIDITRLTKNDIVCLDSWTALVWSIAWSFSNTAGIDLTDPEKTDWEGYRWCGSLATFILSQLKAFPCHVIVVAHEDIYEKRKQIDAKTQKVEWTKTQVKSTSGPHAMQVGQKFSDVLHFTLAGTNHKIEVAPEQWKDAKSRSIPPRTYNWNELQFKNVINYAGLKTPKEEGNITECEGVKYFPAGIIPDFNELAIGSATLNALGIKGNAVLDGAPKPKVKLSGLMGLAQKAAATETKENAK